MRATFVAVVLALCAILTRQTLAASPNALVFAISISASSTNFFLPLGQNAPSRLDIMVSWGDNYSSSYTSATYDSQTFTYGISHTYANVGEYQISVDSGITSSGPWLRTLGWYPGLGSYSGWASMSNVRLLNVSSFGSLGTQSFVGLFHQCVQIFTVPSNIPSTVTEMQYMFAGATEFNDLAVSSWNVSMVQATDYMFYYATKFNQSLATWDTRSLQSISYMFASATRFNQPLNGWNTKSVVNMAGTFRNSAYNQPLLSWDVSNVQRFDSMFYLDTSFTQPLESWTVTNGYNFGSMFRGASSFNQPLKLWNTRSAKDMSYMFESSAFSQPIGSWNVSSVTTFASMFSMNSAFNQPLIAWNVRAGVDFSNMFSSATSFNQNLSSWTPLAATTMGSMFYNAAAFNQSLQSWCVPNIAQRPNLFANGSALSIEFEPQWGCVYSSPITVEPMPPVMAIPEPLGIGCLSPQPSPNATCVEGRWLINVNASKLSSNSSNPTSVTLEPNTTLIIQDPVVGQNITLIVPIGPTVTSAGQIHVNNCVSLDGQVHIQLSSATRVATGDKAALLFSSRPDCFDVSISTTIDSGNIISSCAPIISAVPSVELETDSASLLLLFSVTTPSSSDPSCLPPSDQAAAVSPGLVAGVVVGAAVGVAAIVAIGIYIRYRALSSETARIQNQIELGSR